MSSVINVPFFSWSLAHLNNNKPITEWKENFTQDDCFDLELKTVNPVHFAVLDFNKP